MVRAKKKNQFASIRHIALDMDGTIYKDGIPFSFTREFLINLQNMGISYTFLTNNNSKTVSEYLGIIQALGLDVTVDNIFTSSQATLRYIQNTYPESNKLFILGTDGMKQEFRNAGYSIVSENPQQEPELVIVGFDTGLTFESLTIGAYWIKQGKPFIATHPDFSCPTDQPRVLVDCGAVCAALEKATGVAPEAIPGKPNPIMLEGIIEKFSLQAHELAVVGDRLNTDIAMTQNSDIVGILVLTGVTAEEDLQTSPFTPDIVVPSIEQLGVLLQRSRQLKVE